MAEKTIDIIQLKHPDSGEIFYPQTHAEGVIGLGTAAKTDSSAYATSTQGSHADDAYNLVKGNKNINTVLAGPASGSAGAASFRKLVENDIPNLSWSKITTDKPTTISGYGITDAKIENGIITLGDSTITPLISHQTLYDLVISDSSNTVQLTYKPNVNGTYSLKLTKALVGLSNVEDTKLSTWTGTNKITTVGTITSGVWNGTKIGYNYLGETYIGTTRTQSSSAAQALTGISSIKATSASESLFEWDATNNAWHFKGGIYSDSFISAGGLSDSSGTSGIDEDGVWTILDATNEVIGVNHIPNITTSKISDLETWIAGKGYVTSSGITSVVKGTATSGGNVSTTDGVVTIQFPTAYTLPLAASGTKGGIKIGYTQSGKNYPVQLSSEKAYVNVPWTDTTYSTGTSTELNTGTSTETRVWTPKVIADYVTGLISAIDQFHYEIASSTSVVTHPASNILYLIGPTGSGSDKYEEYVYTDTWIKIGDTTIDLSGYQPLDANLTAIAGLTGTTGFLKKTAANTWALDTNTYLTGITSTMVTTALGYTPANSTALSNYVLKAGDTMTGALTVSAQVIPVSMEFRNMSSSAGNGGYIDFHFNNSSADFTTRIIESASGILSISGGLSLGTTLQLGNGVLSWDGSANAWKLTGNFYATGFISAGGVSSGGGTAGVDLTAVWNNLVANTGEGLNKKIHTAHLPTVTITGTNISGTATYSGTGGSASTLTLNLTNSGVRSTTINGNYLRVNTNGTNVDLTIPYSSGAGCISTFQQINTESSISTSGLHIYHGVGGDWTGSVTSMAYAAILALGTPSRGWQLWAQRGAGSLIWRNGNDNATAWNTERTILDSANYTSYVNTTNFPGLNKVGTVTSVAMTVPTGLSVSGTPITTSGTLAISLASGYSIPTTVKQSNWDTAYGWGNHANAGYLLASTASSTYIQFNQDIQDLGATHQMGYGYTTHGWPYSGPAMTFGSGKFTAQIQSSGSGNNLYYRQTVNGTAQNWVGIYHTGNLTQSVVTGLIGSTTYAPYNSAGYLPLSAGSNYPLTGAIVIQSGNDSKIILDNTDADTNYQGISFRQNGTEYGKLGVFSIGSTNLHWVSGGITNTVIHSGNYSSYALPLTGGTLKSSERAILYLNEETSSTGVVGPYIGFQVNGVSAAGVGSNSSVGAYLENDNADGHPYVNLDNNGVFKYKNTYTFWHNGNLSPFSETILASAYSFNANELVAERVHYTTAGDIGSAATGWSNFPTTSAPSGSFGLMNFKEGGYPIQFFHSYAQADLWFRYKKYNSGVVWNDWVKIYNSGNANLSTVPWACSTFTASGMATMSGGARIDGGLLLGGSSAGKAFIGDASSGLGSSYTGGLFYVYGNHPMYFHTNGTSRMIITGGGNVGIGVLSPSQKLHVVGAARIDSGGSSESVLQIVSAAGNGSAGHIMFYSNPNQNGFKIASVYSNWASRQDLVFYRSNNTTEPYTFTPIELMRLTHDGAVKVTGNIIAYGQILGNSFEFNPSSSTGHGGYIDFHYNGSTADYTSRIIENASGRLAITGQLAVAGAMSCASLTASGNIQANAGVTIANNQSYGGLDTDGTRRTLLSIDPSNAAFLAWGNAGAGHNTYVSGNNISFTYGTSHTTGMYLNSSGNVGIGTTTPETKLHVHHTGYPNVILSTTSSEASIYYRNSTGVYWAAGPGCWGSMAGYTSFVFGVYSGTGSSAYKAYITNTGNFVAVGAITAGSASDARLKTNIKSLSAEAAKRIVMALKPVTFTWNEKATELYDQYKGNDLGMIAQEVEPYLPQAVGTIFEKYKRLDYTKMISPLVKVAQDHESRIRQLEAENRELRKQLNMN